MARKPHRLAPTHAVDRHRLLSGVVLAIAFVIIVVFSLRNSTTSASNGSVDLTGVRLEIADTDAARMQGLSGRESLDEGTGMLFVFGEPGIYPFWMKDMSFPLDIIWINGNEVVEIVTLQPPTSGMLVPPRHIPFKKADLVLELNAGGAKELGLEVGSRILLPE